MELQLNNKLILIEGIPGSGKSTLTNRLSAYLNDMGLKIKSYNEGELHPIDFAWCGYLTIDEYNQLLKDYPEYKQEIIKNASVGDESAIVAYLGLQNASDELMEYLQRKEIYDGRISAERFMDIHLNIYNQFSNKVNDDDFTYLFECVALQNQVNEILCVQNKGKETVMNYVNKLVSSLKDLNPILIYLKQNDVKKTTSKVAKQRISQNKNKYPDWIDRVIDYICSTPYAKERDLSGFEGLVKYLEARQGIELKILENLPIKTLVIENPDYDWDRVFDTIIKELT